MINNTLTRYYDECEKYMMEVEDDPETSAEEEKYMKGPEITELGRTLSKRLQLNVSDLTPGKH